MTPERWDQISELFHAALEREPGERLSFLAEACAGDEPLLSEVASLISSHEQSGDFIEAPASDVAAELLGSAHARPSVGQDFGPYRVVSLLGAGGMGEVYLADDTRLGRRVALKLLPPQFTADADRVRRFEQEARAASALNHPNIVTIYEIGQTDSAHFIATEFVDGETLRDHAARGRVTLGEALDVAAQIASALSAAHEAGIVHRDIKPENIMLRRDRIVKVLDFGLAKLAPRESAAVERGGPARSMVETRPGVVMGTVAYMSPEQARGEEVDERTDVWSLGVVLYEMLAGRAPFEGETPSHVTVSIMEREPPPLTLYTEAPAELERIVTKALRKDRAERYQSAGDIALDLKSLGRELEVEARLKQSPRRDAGAQVISTEGDGRPAESVDGLTSRATVARLSRSAPSAESPSVAVGRRRLVAALAVVILFVAGVVVAYRLYFAGGGPKGAAAGSAEAADEVIDSLAVLPFVNEGGDPDAEYLSDGISDSIINTLSRLPNLKVISLSSVMRYKGKQVDPQAVGRDLNVRAVLTGRLVRQGNTLAISTELVDARDSRRLWGEQYTRRPSDILAVQDEIAREIAGRLRLRLTGEEQRQLARRYTDNTAAYELYILGLYHVRKETREDLYRGVEYFERAIKIDPSYALAYAGLARAYGILGQRGFWSSREAHEKAEWAALKALEIDDTLSQAHAMLGYVKRSNWDWAGAEREFKRAIELEPNNANAHFLYSVHLMNLGRTDEAVTHAKLASEPDALGFSDNQTAFVYLFAHEFDKAIELFLKADVERRGSFQLAECYLAKGMYEEAVVQSQRIVARDSAPEKWQGYPLLAYAYAAAGRRAEALKILDEQKRLSRRGYISPYNFAVIYTGLGDNDKAFEYLDKAYEEGNQNMPHFPKRPMFDRLHSDPRYAELLRKMNYPL